MARSDSVVTYGTVTDRLGGYFCGGEFGESDRVRRKRERQYRTVGKWRGKSRQRSIASWARIAAPRLGRPPNRGPRDAHLGKGGASLARCIPPEQGPFAPPCTRRRKGVPALPTPAERRSASRRLTNRAPVWIGARAVPLWTGSMGAIAALTRPSATLAAIPCNPASGFRARHHEPGRGCLPAPHPPRDEPRDRRATRRR